MPLQRLNTPHNPIARFEDDPDPQKVRRTFLTTQSSSQQQDASEAIETLMGRVTTESRALAPQEETASINVSGDVVSTERRSSPGALTRITPDGRRHSQSLYDVFRRSRDHKVESTQMRALTSLTTPSYGNGAFSSHLCAASQVSAVPTALMAAREHTRFRRAP